MPEASLAITADNSQFVKALEDCQEKLKSSFDQMQGTIEGLGGAFEKIQHSIIGLTSLLAGGAAFKDVIESTKSWGEGNILLSKALGISAEKAAAYQVALQHLGIGNDVLISASEKLSKQIYSNSAAFEKVGIATKGSSGQFREVGDVLQDVFNYLNRIQDPIERNIAGTQLLGKGWGEFRQLLKLSNDEMEKAAVRAKELGLATNKEDIEAYNFAMRDLSLTVTALENEFGKALLPTLTQLALAFKDSGPASLEVFGTFLKVMAYTAGTVAIEFEKLGLWLGKLGAQATALVHGDFAQIGAIQKDFSNDINALTKSADELWDKLNRPPPAKTKEDTVDDSPHDFDPKDNDKRLDAFQHELELELAALRKKHEAEMLVYKQEEDAFAKAAGARIAIAEQEVAAELRTYGKGSPEYERAQEHLVQIKQKADDELRQMADAFSKVETDRQQRAIADQEKILDQQFQHQEITNAQLLTGELALEDKRTQIARKGIEDRKALVDPMHDPVQYATLLAQIESLELQHQQKITEINQQAVQRDKLVWDQFDKTIQDDFQKSLTGMLEGTTTFSAGIKNLTKSLEQSFAQLAAKNIASMIQQAIVGKTIRAQEIAADAGKAASGAYAAIAGIPYVGPFLAPAAAVVAYGAVMAFDSAAGGYDIPAGVMPKTQLHEREMVLPASIANPLRDAIAGGQLGGSGGGIHLHTSNIDSRSMEKSLRRGGALEKTMRKLHKRMKR